MSIKTSVNCMCKDEPFVALGLLSLLPYVDEALVVDTGSEQKYLDQLNKVRSLFPDKMILVTIKVGDDGQNWSVLNGVGLKHGISDTTRKELGETRRQMQRLSRGEFIVTLDGDEVWTEKLAKIVFQELIPAFPKDKSALFLPFIDFCHNFRSVRLDHNMGRVFKKESVEVVGEFPEEMHWYKEVGGKPLYCLENYSPHAILLKEPRDYPDGCCSVHHYESLCKPYRKSLNIKREYFGKLPEVFFDYPEFTAEVMKWDV